MLIIGCDFHTRYQQIALMDEATGELTERRLEHENGEALLPQFAQVRSRGHRSQRPYALVRGGWPWSAQAKPKG